MVKHRWLRVVGAVAIICPGIVACASSNGVTTTGTSTSSGLVRSLDRIAATSDTRRYIEFGRPKDVTAANGSNGLSGPYGRLVGYGASDVRALFNRLPDTIGLDPRSADIGVVVGQPPHTVGLFVGGSDATVLGAHLQALGGTDTVDGSATTWRLRADNSINLNDPLGKALPQALSRLNVVRIDGTALIHGPSVADVASLDGSAAERLSGDASFVDVARCLGDPLAAILTNHAGSTGAIVGLGVSGSRGETAEETLCVTTESEAAATALAEHMTSALATGNTPSTKRPWSGLLVDAKVSVVGGATHVVRLTAHPGPTVTVLFDALSTRDLEALIGS